MIRLRFKCLLAVFAGSLKDLDPRYDSWFGHSKHGLQQLYDRLHVYNRLYASIHCLIDKYRWSTVSMAGE